MRSSDPRLSVYECPECHYRPDGKHRVHCDLSDEDPDTIELVYVDILSALMVDGGTRAEIEDRIGIWTPLHKEVFAHLKSRGDIAYQNDLRQYELVPDSNQSQYPQTGPLSVLWEVGTVNGCHDYGTFAMLVWFASKENTTWMQVKEEMQQWYERTGMWDPSANTWLRDGIDERNPDALLESKYHVYENRDTYGWGKAARQAVAVLQSKGIVDTNGTTTEPTARAKSLDGFEQESPA